MIVTGQDDFIPGLDAAHQTVSWPLASVTDTDIVCPFVIILW